LVGANYDTDLKAYRPDADDMTGNIGVTGPSAIADSDPGRASMDWPLWVAYAGAAPSAGDERGTATDSFELTADKAGFKVLAVRNSLALIAPISAYEGDESKTKIITIIQTALGDGSLKLYIGGVGTGTPVYNTVGGALAGYLGDIFSEGSANRLCIDNDKCYYGGAAVAYGLLPIKAHAAHVHPAGAYYHA
jgi:hypothetical protein